MMSSDFKISMDFTDQQNKAKSERVSELLRGQDSTTGKGQPFGKKRNLGSYLTEIDRGP